MFPCKIPACISILVGLQVNPAQFTREGKKRNAAEQTRHKEHKNKCKQSMIINIAGSRHSGFTRASQSMEKSSAGDHQQQQRQSKYFMLLASAETEEASKEHKVVLLQSVVVLKLKEVSAMT